MTSSTTARSSQDVVWWKELEGDPSFAKVLVAGGFVSKEKVKSMDDKEQREALINQLSEKTSTGQKNYGKKKDSDIMATGGILVCLLRAFPELFDENKKLLSRGELSDTLKSKILDVYARQMSGKWLNKKSDWDLVRMAVNLAKLGKYIRHFISFVCFISHYMSTCLIVYVLCVLFATRIELELVI